MIRLIYLFLLATTAAVTIADDFVCRSGNEMRMISVDYEHKGWQVPCRVKYEKPATNSVEYPWNAQASPGYCEDRARFLVSKLENWGWVCTKKEPVD